jgi:hypothetical protein
VTPGEPENTSLHHQWHRGRSVAAANLPYRITAGWMNSIVRADREPETTALTRDFPTTNHPDDCQNGE